MSSIAKKRRCQQCGHVLHKASLDVLIEHMESSELCKSAIRTCESCLMKFPDDTSLMKHVGRKKQCLERHNIGHVDPTVVQSLPIFNEQTAGCVDSITFQAKQDKDRHPGQSLHGNINSYATYAFPHNTKNTSTIFLPSQQGQSYENNQNTGSSNFDDDDEVANSAQFSPPPNSDTSLGMIGGDEHLHDQSSSEDDDSWLPSSSSVEQSSSGEDDDYDEDEEHLDEEHLDEEEARNRLKSIADMIRRRNMTTFHLPTDVQMVMDLYQRLVGNGSSLNTFDDVLDWAIHHSLIGDHVPKRKPMIKQVSEAVYGKEFLRLHRPKQHRVPLCTGRVAEVTVFDIRTILVDLLCNEDLMQRGNLVYGDSNFTDVHAGIPDDDVYDDVNTGIWWKESAERIKMEHPHLQDRSVLWPLIFFIDGVSHGEFTNLNQEPVLVTFSAFKRTIRNKPQAWRPLAYIDYKGNLKGKVSPYLALNEYHEVLSAVFSGLTQIQATGMNWTLTLPGEEPKDVVLFFPIQFIIGDCEGHDKLCGRFSSHNNTPGLVRDCDVLTAMGDDTNHVCRFYTKDEMDNYTEDELNAKSFHRIVRPCHNPMDFGFSEQGVHGATLPEKTHAFDMGSCKEVGDLYPLSLSSAANTRTDDALSYMIHHTRLPPALRYPVISPYRAGLDKVRKLKAYERIGKIFSLYCILLSSYYVEFVYDNPKAGEHKELFFDSLKQQMKVMEKILCFHDWLAAKKHTKQNVDPDDDGNESVSLLKIRNLMLGIKLYFPRPQGMGWRLTKFHQLLHFPHNIRRHGSALNFDGGRPEYYGKYFCKDLTTRTQRRQISLGKQTAQRYFEISSVLEAERVLAQSNTLTYRDPSKYMYFTKEVDDVGVNDDTDMENNDDPGNNHHPKLKARLCTLSLHPNNNRKLVYKWPNKKFSEVDGFQLPNDVYNKIAARIWNSRNGGRLHRYGTLKCFSECVLPNGHIVRSHPLYNSEKPWYDWVTVRWDDFAEPLPAKVLLMFKIEDGPIENYNIVGDTRVDHVDQFLEIGKKYAIVQTVTGDIFNYRQNRFHLKSKLAVRYTLENDLRLIEIDSIEALTFVLMNDIGAIGDVLDGNDDNSIIMFRERSLWKDLFLEL